MTAILLEVGLAETEVYHVEDTSAFLISSKPCSSMKASSSSSSMISNCWVVVPFLPEGTMSYQVKTLLLVDDLLSSEDMISTLEDDFSTLEDDFPPLEDYFFSSVNLDTFSTTESMMENFPSDDSEISLFIRVPEPLPPLLPWLRVSD
jgi:hypothetical protein